MTSRCSLTLLFSATALSLCLSSHAEARKGIKASLQAIYESRDKAFANKDVTVTLAPYAADVTIIDADGNQTKGVAAQRGDLSRLFAGDIIFSAPKTEIEDFAAGETSRDATVEAARHITISAKSAKTGQVTYSVVEEKVRDHWVEGKNGWHITQERRLTPSTLLELCSAAAAGPQKNKIIGKWVGYLPSRPGTTAVMTVEFREDGTESQTIVAPRQNISLEATYTVKDNALTETLVSGTKNGVTSTTAGKVQVLHYRFDGDTLLISLTGSPSDELRFTRQPD